MRSLLNSPLSRHLCAGLAVAGFALAAAPAFAQSAEEITVVGRMGPDGQPRSLSRVVSIADLDLRSDAGVDAMRLRIRDTAHSLCTELGETRDIARLGTSCEDLAVKDAMAQGRVAIAQARSPAALAAAGEPAAPSADAYAPPASAVAPDATYTTTTVTNGPVADTPENRARFGGPMSHAGRKTAAVGD